MLALTLLVALLLTTALGFHVFSVAPGRAEHRAFALFTWLLALWIVNDLTFWAFHRPDEDGGAWANTAFLVALAVQLAFLRFAWVYPYRRRVGPARLAGISILVGVTLLLIASGRAMGPIGFHAGEFHLELVPGTFVVGAAIYGLFLLGRRLTTDSMRRTDDPRIRSQLHALHIAALVTGALTSACGVLLPLLGIYAFLPLTSIGILIGSLIHGYAVLEFRLLREESILDRVRLFPVTVKLAFAVIAAIGATVLLNVAIGRRLIGPGDWLRALVYSLAAGSLPAMALIFMAQRLLTDPLRELTEAALEVRDGRTDRRVAVPGGSRDELSLLSEAFNGMVDRLERDIAALRAMSDGLLRAERLATAGALSAGVAHEVNNPLAAVSSLVQLVRSRSEDARSREMLDRALEQMDRISRALQDLMALARPREEQRRRVRLGQIAEETLRLLRYDKSFRRLTIKVELDESLPPIELDPDRIQQVVLNLLINARDALADTAEPVIHVRSLLAREGARREHRLEIEDNGPGISSEDQARIFEPFFSTKAPGAGTGLGLAVCRDILSGHEGKLEVRSEPGRGCAFVLRLPADETGEETNVEAGAETSDNGRDDGRDEAREAARSGAPLHHQA